MGCTYSTEAVSGGRFREDDPETKQQLTHDKSRKLLGKALIYAVQNESVQVVENLIQTPGIDVNFQDARGRTALMHVALGTAEHMVQLEKTDENWHLVVDLQSAKDKAVQWNETMRRLHRQETDRQLVSRLLVQDHRSNLNIVDQDGRSALHFAVISGNTRLLRLLLSSPDVDTNLCDVNGDTPLMWACGWGHASRHGDKDVAYLLIDACVDVNTSNNDGFTPLMCASSWGHHKVVKHLIRCGADINKVDKNGNTALMLASQLGHAPTVSQLIQGGAEISVKNKLGFDAFLLALIHGKPKCAHALLKAGAVLTLTDPGAFGLLMNSLQPNRRAHVQDMLAFQRCLLTLRV